MSLQSATRTRGQGSEDPVYYRISDSTHIAKVPLKKLLSHTKTKAELTTFLAKKVKERGQVLRRQLVVAWGKECEATHKDMGHLQSDHEEADTKIILHAVDATADGATDLTIHSPDTDVLVVEFHGMSWSSMEFHEVLMEVHGISWNIVEFHGMLWGSLKYRWSPMECHNVSMEFDRIPCILYEKIH